MSALGRLARLLLWDYERGTLPYDALWLLILLLLFLLPAAWWGDPLAGLK